MPSPSGVSAGQALRAARLFAESRSPFAQSDSVIVPGPRGCGVWWWDMERVRELVGAGWVYDSARIVPETALQPTGHGWRQVEVSDGYEAQCWQAGSLVGSVWRRRPLTADQWTSFARSLGTLETGDTASEVVPEPVNLSLSMAGFSRVSRLKATDRWQMVERGAAAVVCVALFISAGLAGRAFGYEGLAADALQKRDEIAAKRPRDKPGDLASRLTLLRSVETLQNRPQPLQAVAELYRVLQISGVTPLQFSVEDDYIQAQIKTEGTVTLQSIASALEASPWFQGVAPDLDNSTGLANLSAHVCNAAGDKPDRTCPVKATGKPAVKPAATAAANPTASPGGAKP